MTNRLLLLALLLTATVFAPRNASAQHASHREILDLPAPGVTLACAVVPAPSQSIPPSALSYRISYVTLVPDTAGGPPQMKRHQDFTIVWDSAGRLLIFGGSHQPTETDTLHAGFVLAPSAGDSMEGRWLFPSRAVVTEPMDADEQRTATALAAHFWTRRCTGSPIRQRQPQEDAAILEIV